MIRRTPFRPPAYVHRSPPQHAKRTDWSAGVKALLVCSYFIYVDPHLARKGIFQSRYWDGLPALAAKLGLSINWLQLYQAGDVVANPQAALEWAARFNEKNHENGFHAFLDAQLCPRLVLRVLRRWLRLLILSWRLRDITRAFVPQGSQLSFWPVMRKDWYASMRGGRCDKQAVGD